MNISKNNIGLLLIYTLIFTCLFISYPLHGSLPSDMDSWFYVAWFNYYYNFLGSIFTGGELGQTFYPDAYPYLLGEPSFGIFLIWLPFKLSGLGEIWSYFFMMLFILALNAYSVSKLAASYFPSSSQSSQFVAGLFFTVSNFAIANIDNPNTIFWAVGIFAVYYFRKTLASGNMRFLYVFSFLFLIQLIISVYNAMYTAIFVFAVMVFNVKKLGEIIKISYKHWLTCIVAGSIITFGYVYLLLGIADKTGYWNYSSNLYVVKYLSFHWKDFFRVLPGNIYHPRHSDTFWAFYYKSFFIGFTATALSIWGLITQCRKYPELILVVLFATLMGMGTFIVIGGKMLLMPLGLLFEKFDLYTFYRFPFRMFLVINLVIALLCVIPIERIIKNFKYKWVIASLIALVFLVENIPLKRQDYGSDKYIAEGKYLETKFRHEPMSNFLFLPTGDFVDGQTNNINRTENIYMYWQSCIRKNVMNGYSSFFPPERMELNNALLRFKTDPQLFQDYLKKYHVRHIIYYRDNWKMEKCPVDPESLSKIAGGLNIQLLIR